MTGVLRHRGFRVLLAAASGLVLQFAVPKWNVEACVWLWIYPLLTVLWLADFAPGAASSAAGSFRRAWWLISPVRQPFFLGWIAGLAFFGPTLRWVRHSPRVLAGAEDSRWVGWEPELEGLGTWAAMAGFMALYFAVWSAFAAHVARPRRAVLLNGSWLEVSVESIRASALAAAFWVVMEWARGLIITGFAWNGLGVALLHNPVLVQTADIVGIAGTSFLPVFVSCVVFNTVRRVVVQYQTGRRFRFCFDTTAAVLLLAGTSLYGLLKMAETRETIPVKVACVQMNQSQVDFWRGEHVVDVYQRYAELTRAYAEKRDDARSTPVDLVLWPEGAVYLPFDHPEHREYFDNLLGVGDFSLLAGCSYHGEGGKPSYNSAALFTHGYDHAQLYHKVHLVPFGEYLPFRHTLPLMNTLLGGLLPGDFDFGPSTDPLLLEKPKVQVIPLICFEDTVGGLARQFVRDAPQLIANLSNDGWFLDSDEMEQQRAAAAFRCIELRRPMVRATNTGVTCLIDERGVETARLADPDTGSTMIQGVLPGTVNVPLHPVITFYARHGDVFSLLCLVACLAAIAGHWLAGRKASQTSPNSFANVQA